MALTTSRSPGAKAGAYRADLSVGCLDFFEGHDGSFNVL